LKLPSSYEQQDNMVYTGISIPATTREMVNGNIENRPATTREMVNGNIENRPATTREMVNG
jgi:hypothetical protein